MKPRVCDFVLSSLQPSFWPRGAWLSKLYPNLPSCLCKWGGIVSWFFWRRPAPVRYAGLIFYSLLMIGMFLDRGVGDRVAFATFKT